VKQNNIGTQQSIVRGSAWMGGQQHYNMHAKYATINLKWVVAIKNIKRQFQF
jgi:hypothetical protein